MQEKLASASGCYNNSPSGFPVDGDIVAMIFFQELLDEDCEAARDKIEALAVGGHL